MNRLLTEGIWPTVSNEARKAKRRYGAIAYVTSGEHLPLQANDILVCDASDGAIKSGETSAKVLRRFHRRGVNLYSLSGLHAKTLVFGETAMIGSCNASRNTENLHEAALLTDVHTTVSQVRAYVWQLVESGDALEIDARFLDRIEKLPVVRRGGRARKRARLSSLGGDIWVVSVRELDEGAFEDEQGAVEEAEERVRAKTGIEDLEPSSIRFTGRSLFRREARAGDSVVQIWTPVNGKRAVVYPPVGILFRQDEDHWTRFYIRDEGEEETISWTAFEKALKRAGVKGLTRRSVRKLTQGQADRVRSIWSA